MSLRAPLILLPTSTIVMTGIPLSAKFGNEWTANELTAFNIRIETIDAATFFNTAQLPNPPVAPAVLTNESQPQGLLAKQDRLFFQYMKDAVHGEEAFVNDFAAFILGMLEYDQPGCVIHQQKKLFFDMCDMTVDTEPNVCVMSHGYLLLVQEAKVHPSFFSNCLS